MARQLHKRFSDEQAKMLLEKYTNEKVELCYILETPRIRRRRFFQLLKEYREDPDNFSIQYKRKRATRKISKDLEKNIISELAKGKKLIEDKSIPITFYNYSYIKDQIYQAYGQKVSVPTIINRAKNLQFSCQPRCSFEQSTFQLRMEHSLYFLFYHFRLKDLFPVRPEDPVFS